MAVKSAEPYADHLHLAPDKQPHQHHIIQTFTGRMLLPSWCQTNSVKTLKAQYK